MVSKEDWNAAISSEVFREYLKDQLTKKSQQEQKPKDDLDKVLIDFEELEKKINNDPQMKRAFRALRDKFLIDAEYRQNTKASFVEGVMLLNLDD